MSTLWFLFQWNPPKKEKAYMNSDFIWVKFLPALLKSPCDCASSWVWVPGEALLALEQLCAACTPVEGKGGSVGELQNSRLTGATDKTEAMLDQQPKTNQVKQQPHSSSGLMGKGWREAARTLTENVGASYTHTIHASSIIYVCLDSVL